MTIDFVFNLIGKFGQILLNDFTDLILMSSSITIGKMGLRWSAMLLSALWAGVHMSLAGSAILPNHEATFIYRVFFGFTASLAIIAAIVFVQGLKSLYLPATVFYGIDLALLVETRTAPALFVGKVLLFNPYVTISLALDVILLGLSIVLWLVDK